MNELNTIVLQNFIKQVKDADLSNQREIRLDLKTAKNLTFCLSEVLARLVMDYNNILVKASQPSEQNISVQVDGGDFKTGA